MASCLHGGLEVHWLDRLGRQRLVSSYIEQEITVSRKLRMTRMWALSFFNCARRLGLVFLSNLNVIQFLPFLSICLPCLCAGCFGSITLQCLLRLCFISINPLHAPISFMQQSSALGCRKSKKRSPGIQPDAYAGFLDRILLASPNKILCISLKICLDGVCAGWLLLF